MLPLWQSAIGWRNTAKPLPGSQLLAPSCKASHFRVSRRDGSESVDASHRDAAQSMRQSRGGAA